MRISEILTPSFRTLRDLTQISQISQMFLGSPTAQNFKKILMKILILNRSEARITLNSYFLIAEGDTSKF